MLTDDRKPFSRAEIVRWLSSMAEAPSGADWLSSTDRQMAEDCRAIVTATEPQQEDAAHHSQPPLGPAGIGVGPRSLPPAEAPSDTGTQGEALDELTRIGQEMGDYDLPVAEATTAPMPSREEIASVIYASFFGGTSDPTLDENAQGIALSIADAIQALLRK